jgi:tetratricopeptide (TPR) repeat protein
MLDWYLHAVVSADAALMPNRPRDFLAPYEPSAPPPRFPRTSDALAWFEREYDCLRSIVSWAGDNGWAGHAWRTAIAATTLFDALIPWREGIDFFELALHAAERAGDPVGTGFVLNSLGCIHLDKEDWRRAKWYFLRALAVFQDCAHLRGESMACGNIAIACAHLGEHQRAVRHSVRAVTLCGRLKYRRGIGMNLDNLGLTLASMGKDRQAIACYLRAEAIFRDTGDTHNIAMNQHALGLSYTSAAQWRPAIRAFREAVAVFRQLGNRRWEAIVLMDLGKCLHLAGHPRFASDALEKAHRTMSEFADPKAKQIQAIIDQLAAD